MIDETALKQILAAVLGVDAAAITADSNSDTIESWDSLRHMNLVLALEEEFGVSIPDEEAANITSYALIKLVLEELTAA
ncbi:MAG: acyl carrier protein [Phenylobacterium sp.]|jgi:acyl carrier protein|uniref:acyl carrier protein n=1 Tax=Phenylobacterium sp. TaxID=1871053 RepID=UPI001B6DE707|nr:phosphopantetheine-binding protein [Phenylobacterium sp.]MBP7649707.1 acyl carrier protein [Phenylobacterium sp.]MBP7815677.1 acyl carrier protein [Phenylobacterium sp.]MBP9230761.1 acyl carrier protein [Phenylobacterium sp.]MBP9754446.1 acyl carrier protein [Phenylobacterium sp.]